VSPINEHDLDRLADYGASLLDPAETAEVRRLIEEDPAWARANADLTAAGPRLDAALSGLRHAPIPREVADRLNAVLALQSPPAGTRTAKVIDLAARRARMRRAGRIATAAAVVAAIFGGVLALNNTVQPNSGTSAGSRNNSAPLAAGAPPLTIRHSGLNYTPQNLPSVDLNPQTLSKNSTSLGSSKAVPAPQDSRPPAMPGAAPVPDAPLENDSALDQCLATISARYGGVPTLVDYAFFQGSAALIVVLNTGTGRLIVVVGPRCGQPGVGTDDRYRRTG